jgi:MFS family permease
MTPADSKTPTTDQPRSGSPARAPVLLGTLILVAAVANLNLTVANVALPSIGQTFDASQVALNMIAVGYSLGLAASVLWFGALGDRYGRKLTLILGLALAVPASLVAGFAPSSFLDGDELAYIAGFVAVLLGAAMVFFRYPRKDDEERARAAYHAEDEAGADPADTGAAGSTGTSAADALDSKKREDPDAQ